MHSPDNSAVLTLGPTLALARRQPTARPHFIVAGPKRVINLAHILDAEWRGKELVITTVLPYTAPDGEQGPWLIFLKGRAADEAWKALTGAVAPCETAAA